VLLAVNGTVVGASPLFRYLKADNSFAILLPPALSSQEATTSGRLCSSRAAQ
jgi:hypothetical protein